VGCIQREKGGNTFHANTEYDHYHVLSHESEPEYMRLLDVRIALPGGAEEIEEEERVER
jgi:hypothetical protein